MPRTPPSKLVRNEKIKLLATALNNVGIATIVAGAIGPVIARSYGAPTPNSPLFSVWLATTFLLSGLALIATGRSVLGGLRE